MLSMLFKMNFCFVYVIFQAVREQAQLLNSTCLRQDHCIVQARRDVRSLDHQPARCRVCCDVQTRLLRDLSSLVFIQPEPVLFQCSYICCFLSASQKKLQGGRLSFGLSRYHLFSWLKKLRSLSLSSEQMLWSLTVMMAIHWTCFCLCMSSLH